MKRSNEPKDARTFECMNEPTQRTNPILSGAAAAAERHELQSLPRAAHATGGNNAYESMS